jgi:hypothetical protein
MSAHSTQDEKTHDVALDGSAQSAADNQHGIATVTATAAASSSAEQPDPRTMEEGKLSAHLGGHITSQSGLQAEDDPPEASDSAALSDSMPPREIPYYEEPNTLLHPPDFRPLFTLIEDPATDTHHHPTVHYLFSDDDPDILTAAALETLSDRQHEVEERFVVVDMSADGNEVVAASSFSPEWQALKTRVMQAPSWGDQTGSVERGLMLRIEGKETGSGSRAKKKGDVDGLLKAFDQAMGGLDEALGLTSAAEKSAEAPH